MSELTAIKGNVQITLDNPAEAESFSKQGYDVYDGKTLVKPAADKKVSYEEYLKALEGNSDKALKKENKALKAENEELKQELELLKAQLESEELPDSLE